MEFAQKTDNRKIFHFTLLPAKLHNFIKTQEKSKSCAFFGPFLPF